MKRFYLTCPSCKKTAMSGIDIYESRILKCNCGAKIRFDLERIILKECEKCGKNIAFPVSGGDVQKCILCGFEQKTVHPAVFLDGSKKEIFEQLQELLNKGIITKVKLAKAGGLLNQIGSDPRLNAYVNHINNYNDYVMYETEYNSAVRVMNETLLKMEQSLEYDAKDELAQEEKTFLQLSKRFVRLGNFKGSDNFSRQCTEKASVCNKAINSVRPAVSSQTSQKSYSSIPPEIAAKKSDGKKVALVIAAAVAAIGIGAVLLIVGRQNDGPGMPFSSASGSTEGVSTGTSGASANDPNDIYNEFYSLMHEQNYDIYSLNLYDANLRGYNDADSIFEANKDGFYNTFSASAESYVSSGSYDIFTTVECLDGLTKLDHYKDCDKLINSVIDNNLKYVRQYESKDDYSNAGAILLDMGDYVDAYTGSETLKDYFYNDAAELSGKDKSNDERILAADLFGCIEDYKDAAELKARLEA